MKPRFLIIGAQKAGTSSLHKMLGLHPLCIPSRPKEIHFFDQDEAYAKGPGWYLAHFPPKPLRSKGHIVFEASPSYLFLADKTAPRIKALLPDVACIAILRDPVKRAFSAWNMFRDFKDDPRHGHLHDPRSFGQAVEDELAGRTEHRYHKYLARGHYAEQLTVYNHHFPKECILVYPYPLLKQDPGALCGDILRRLHLPPMPADLSLKQVKGNVRPYTVQLDRGLAKELYRYFAPQKAKLRELLGYDIDIWEDHG